MLRLTLVVLACACADPEPVPGSDSGIASGRDAGTDPPRDDGGSRPDVARMDAFVPIGEAPAWFLDAPYGEWVTVAGDRTVSMVLPDPVPRIEGWPGGPQGIMSAWTGGGVDQRRGEFLLLANGGHADYAGNEGYAISLREDAPAWRRLLDPTPNEMLEVGPALEHGAINADGRPRSMHSTFATFGDDRFWYVYQNSYTSGAGDSASACFSFDRLYPGVPNHGEPPLAWRDDLGPWTFYANPNANWSNAFGHAAWDPVGHRVWAVGGNNNIHAPEYWSVETAGDAIGTTTLHRYGGSLDNFSGWIAIAHDLRILVAGGTYNGAIYVLSLDRAGEEGDWQAVTNVEGEGFFESGSGGAYVIGNHTIAIGQPKTLGGDIVRLAIPTTTSGGSTVYDPAGRWAFTRLTPGGARPMVRPDGGNNDVNTKWNIVEDMGNGESAIVTVTDIDGPVYVYRIGTSGL